MTPLQEKTEWKHILVVEDETIIAFNIVSTLKQFGYQADFVSDPEACLETLKKNPPDLVFMDIMLGSDQDGIELAKLVRNSFGIPVVYLTAYSDNQTLERAKTTEPFGYLVKPFNSRDLYITAEMALYKASIQKKMKTLHSRLVESQKWELLGILSAGISHSINNPLTIIVNQTYALLEKLPSGSETEKMAQSLNTILLESERIGKVVRNLTTYAQNDDSHIAFADLTELVEETRTFFHQSLLKENIQWESAPKEIRTVTCQPQRIKHLLLYVFQASRVRMTTSRLNSKDKKIQIDYPSVEKFGKRFQGISIKDSAESVPLEEDPLPNNEIIQEILHSHQGWIEKGEDPDGNRWSIFLPLPS